MTDRIAFGPFTLDLRRRELARDGRALALGSRAADVLCELARRPGELLTKDELLSRVWPDTVVEENNLQVQVSAIRKALGEGAQQWLQTVPGRGYRFAAPLQPARAEASAVDRGTVRFVTSRDGVHLAAAESGSGPVLVRTGLWMTHLEHEWSSAVWGPLNARLGERTRLVRYDQRGMGLSDRDVPPLSFGKLVDDLAAVTEHFAPGGAAVLAISQGAPFAIEYAARHPGRVRCLVLLGGYARGWRKRNDPSLVERGEAFRTLTRLGWGQQNPVFRQLFTSLAMPDATREEMDGFNELQRVSASGDVASQLVDVVGDVDVTGRLREVRVPTLVLHSEHDAWVPQALGRELAQGIAGAQFVSLPSTSHVVMPREPAWERCVTRILSFVERHAG